MLTSYLRIRALVEVGEFVLLPNDDILDEIPRFANVQSNSIAYEGSCQSMVNRSVLTLNTQITYRQQEYSTCFLI